MRGRAGQGRCRGGRGGQVLWWSARARVWFAPCRRSRASRVSGWHLGVGAPPTQRAPVDMGDSLFPEHAERSVSARAAVVAGRDTFKRHVAQPETALQPAAAYGHAAGRGRLVWRLNVDCGDLTFVDGDSLNLQGRRGRAVEMPSTCRGVKRACGVVQRSGCGGLLRGEDV